MPHLNFEDGESLYFDLREPSRDGAETFLFVNPLIGDSDIWEESVAPGLRAEGFGTLTYDFRGLGRSAANPETRLEPTLMVSDLRRLVTSRLSGPPVFVGLGLSGLIAARAVLDGAPTAGLVLINSLMEVGERIGWVNKAAPLLIGEGGVALHMEALLPLLVNEEFLVERRAAGALRGEYDPPNQASGLVNLLDCVAEADWRLPFEALKPPTLVITGLQDRVFLDREVVNRLFARIPDPRAEAWEDAGHLLPIERPEQLTRSLARFARELEDKSAAA